MVVNSKGQFVKKVKGPKPRGLTKFKAVSTEEPQIAESELSENQKRKREQARLKKEAEEKALREEQERIRQVKARKQKEREDRETEGRRLKTEEMFRGMAMANEMNKAKTKQVAKPQAASFETIMQE